jgi:hypothetical protein
MYNLKIQFFAFLNRNLLKTQFLNSLFFVIWFKIVFFVYKITILNAPSTKLNSQIFSNVFIIIFIFYFYVLVSACKRV